MQEYKAIGVMSGTSLDGIDIAFCHFTFKNNQWQFSIRMAETIHYPKEWSNSLGSIILASKAEIKKTDKAYGQLLGENIKQFIDKHQVQPDFICSHGHTVFHQPEKGITLQIGDGKEIAGICQLPVYNDFRKKDVSLGGQGAPLVPIGDKLLFAEYDYCLNLGGFANISFDNTTGQRIAFDICPANIALNYLAKKLGLDIDKGGENARSGKTNQDLLDKLNNLNFYQKTPPKSLGKEWLDEVFVPVLNTSNLGIEDQLRTVTEHIAVQISSTLSNNNKTMLVTGGGAFNTFLMERIKSHAKTKIIVPSDDIINFKEALIFAFLGVLKHRNEINTLRSVTGAKQDSSGGILHLP